jgi:hypothetical protein
VVPKTEALEAVAVMLGHLTVAEAEVRDPRGRVGYSKGVDRDGHAVDKVLDEFFATWTDGEISYGTNFKQGLHGMVLQDVVSPHRRYGFG